MKLITGDGTAKGIYKLDKLGFVGRGRSRHRPRNEPILYGGPYPFFQTGDIKAAEFHLHEFKQTYNERGLAQSKLWEPGTLCITIAANIAETAVLKIEGCFPDSVIGFVPDPSKADVSYIKYYLDLIKLDMQNISKGTTQDNLSLDKLLSFDLHVPEIEVQRKSASILRAYDDLIENNLRRIKILEEMAQLIYREWFVNFRFPGHEDVPLVDSPLGRIPEGWEVTRLSDAVYINPKTPTEKETEKPRVLMKGISTDSMIITEYEMKTGNGGSKFKNFDTLMARITPCLEHGKTGFVQFLPSDDEVGLGSTEFIVLRAKSLNPYYIYFLARDERLRGLAIKSMAGASGRQRVRVECFDKYYVPCPDIKTMRRFAQITSPFFRLIQKLWEQSNALRKTRDLLLPKLISGEIDVSELDIGVGEEA